MFNIQYSAAIIGIGSISNLGVKQGREGGDKSLHKLKARTDIISPVEFSLDRYVPKKKEQRSMSQSQAMAVYAAGLAIENAGVLNDLEVCNDLRLLLSCSIGERDERVDVNILKNRHEQNFCLNSELRKMRPTTILQRLPSLFLANVSMAFDLNGETVSYVGESSAAIASLKYALSTVSSSNTGRTLVGGVFNGQQPIYHEMVGHNKNFPKYQELVFGSAATFTILKNVDQARQEGTCVSELRYWGEFVKDDIAKVLKSVNAKLISIMHELTNTSSLLNDLIALDMDLFNVNDYVGNLFEASTHTQIMLTLSYYNTSLIQGSEAFILSENISGRFNIFSLIH